MKQAEYLKLLSGLFEFKTIVDERENVFVVFKASAFDSIEGIADKTEFEALENHVHLLDNIKTDEFEALSRAAQPLGGAVLCSLKAQYPHRHFRVYVSVCLHDSMILRFHQVWDGEEPYFHPDEFTLSREKVFLFEG